MKILYKFAILLIIVLLMPVFASAQSSQTKVTLKNGVTLTGTMKFMDPLSYLEIEVGGVLTKIPMSEVSSVDSDSDTSSIKKSAGIEIFEQYENEANQLISQLPKEKIINIAGIDVNFVLISGGKISYGYDGKGSWKNESEPVHDVFISPFYVSALPVSSLLASKVLGKDYWDGYEVSISKDYEHPDLNDYQSIIESLAYFSLNKRGEIFNYARDYDEEMGSANNYFPNPSEFIQSLNEHSASNKFQILSEAQWAYLYLLNSSQVLFPVSPEFVGQINMGQAINPIVEKYMTKGLTYHHIDAYDNRHTFGNVEIDHFFKKKGIRLGKGHMLIAPLHIVLPAK